MVSSLALMDRWSKLQLFRDKFMMHHNWPGRAAKTDEIAEQANRGSGNGKPANIAPPFELDEKLGWGYTLE